MFNEQNAVENFIRDLLTGAYSGKTDALEPRAEYDGVPLTKTTAGLGWTFVLGKDLPRTQADVLLMPLLRDALIKLNPCIAARPDFADEVLYKLRAILLSVHSDGLVKANEEFAAWLRGERTMPFGPNNEHVPVLLIDFADWRNNHRVVSTQVTFKPGAEKRFDLVLWVNGIPLVVGEAKTPTRPAVSWVDGAAQVHDDYERSVPAFFVPNVFSFATEGKTFRFGSIKMPIELWGCWRDEDDSYLPTPKINGGNAGSLSEVKQAVQGLLRPEVVLDILENFTLYATDKKYRKIKVLCRYQQYQTANQIVERVAAGRIKRGLIWHFQGSGKSLLMVFAAQKLRRHAALKAPTVIIVVDRVELDAQITATFNAADIPNVVTVDSRDELKRLLTADTRKLLITTIHKFGEASGVLNSRDNIILMVDEAHRTQEGDLGQKMREAIPNGFLFGLTGTPINKKDRNTFWAFGAEEDAGGYMSRYSFEESIRDGATLPLHFEARRVELRVDKAAIDAAFAELTGKFTEEDSANLSQQAAKVGVLVKAPERIQAVCEDIAKHFREKVAPNGFKAQIVTYDQESCHLYKAALDRIFPPEASEVVISVGSSSHDPRLTQYKRSRDEEERLLDRFRDPADPLQFLIVTARLLTGFDAPILQTMYLDKPLKEHTLLQAICRANRPFPNKTHGLIVDYLGIFDEVAQALAFDEDSMKRVITNLDLLKERLPELMRQCLDFFPNVDRAIPGYEGLMIAQECLPDNDTRDEFARAFSVLNQLWEALSPDPSLTFYRGDYRWLGQVYESVKPPSGNGKLIWHALGAKTIELIHENIHLEGVHDDLETLVMNPEVLAGILERDDPKKAQEIEIQIVARLRRHGSDPKFIALGQRLEDLKSRYEQGVVVSLAFLKELLAIARDVLESEQRVDPVEEQDRAKAALSELFQDVRTENLPVMVERIVTDIDEIVRTVRFTGWQETLAGEREVKKALRKVLLKYKLADEQELFDKAYAYIRQYYAL